MDGIVYFILSVFPDQLETGYAVRLAEIGGYCVTLHRKFGRIPRKPTVAGFRPKAAVTSGNHRTAIIFSLKTPFLLIQHGNGRPAEEAFGRRIGGSFINTRAVDIAVQKSLDHGNFLGIVMISGQCLRYVPRGKCGKQNPCGCFFHQSVP